MLKQVAKSLLVDFKSQFIEEIKEINDSKTLGQIIKYLPKSKLNASVAVESGKYPLFVSSVEQTKRYNIPQYNDECVLIGNGGVANVSYYNGKFASTSHMFICKPKDESVLTTRYLYLYLNANLHLLQEGFKGSGLQNVSKEYIEKIKVIIPPLEHQMRLIQLANQTDKSKFQY